MHDTPFLPSNELPALRVRHANPAVGDTQTAGADTVESSGLPAADVCMQSAGAGEVRRLRVAPEWRRRGVATALIRELIAFSETTGLQDLVLNTTSTLPTVDSRLERSVHRHPAI